MHAIVFVKMNMDSQHRECDSSVRIPVCVSLTKTKMEKVVFQSDERTMERSKEWSRKEK